MYPFLPCKLQLEYGDLQGNEGMWYNEMRKNNDYGFTSLGSGFVDTLPYTIKPYKYVPGSTKKVPKLDGNGNQLYASNGKPQFQTVKDVESNQWKTKIANLRDGVSVGSQGSS
jgi:hypothetical protein